MSEKLQAVRGTKDLLPEQYQSHVNIIKIAESISSLYGYRSMATPIIEHTGVFSRTLGDTSEVVNKEIYSFLDRSDDSIALRPEFTAGVMRAFISNGLHHQLPLKWFTTGPLFRYDRPQAGRQRQFHQINFEHLGADGPYTDAEFLKLTQHLLKELQILDYLTLELNSIGCKESRAAYTVALKEYFSKYKEDLSEESKIRLEKNPMRILDSKSEQDKKLVADSPIITSYYTDESKKYFDEVLSFLELLNVKYTLNPRLVRGLDYYCHTAFEYTTDKLGAQSTVLGGGRYDGLCKMMGGPEVHAIGCAAGIERIDLIRDFKAEFPRPIMIIPVGDENIEYAAKIADRLRELGKVSMVEHKGKIAKKMQNADKMGARYAVFLGSNEIEAKEYKLRSMDDGSERMISEEELIKL